MCWDAFLGVGSHTLPWRRPSPRRRVAGGRSWRRHRTGQGCAVRHVATPGPRRGEGRAHGLVERDAARHACECRLIWLWRNGGLYGILEPMCVAAHGGRAPDRWQEEGLSVSEAPTYHNYIGGEWIPTSTGAVGENRNPATGDLIGYFPRSAQADVDRAVAAAAEAYRSWRTYPAPRRGEILYRVGEILMRRKEEIARSMTQEMGKVLVEARGDVQEGIDMAYYMAGEGRRLFGQIVPAELPNKSALAVRDPIGVVACITPWNFPVAIPSWKTMAALIAGNTVVLKPASDTPLSAIKLVEAFEEAGLPAGVLNIVCGGGEDVGMPLVRHPDVAAISFTGSNDIGRRGNGEAPQELNRVTLEPGGKNAGM